MVDTQPTQAGDTPDLRLRVPLSSPAWDTGARLHGSVASFSRPLVPSPHTGLTRWLLGVCVATPPPPGAPGSSLPECGGVQLLRQTLVPSFPGGLLALPGFVFHLFLLPPRAFQCRGMWRGAHSEAPWTWMSSYPLTFE